MVNLTINNNLHLCKLSEITAISRPISLNLVCPKTYR